MRWHLRTVAEIIRKIGSGAVSAACGRVLGSSDGCIVDSYVSVIEKAMRGNGLRKCEVAEMTGSEAIYALCQGEFTREGAARVAGFLGLSTNALCGLGEKRWFPPLPSVKGLRAVSTKAYGLVQNTWIAWSPDTATAVVFDPPADCSQIARFLEAHRLRLSHAFITHSHPDDCFGLDELRRLGAEAFCAGHAPLPGAELLTAGQSFRAGGLTVHARSTPGHTEDCVSYVIAGLATPVAIVGDSILAGSMGCAMYSYGAALKTVRTEILTLPESTVICPRHGPMSTVGAEKSGNPFFAT